MSQYLLDTNICIHYLKGEYNLQRKITQVGFASCFLSEITIAELLYGVENSIESKRDGNRERVLALQASFGDRILPITPCFDEYARQKAMLRRTGRVIGEFDMLIGSTAIVKGMTLVTRNTKHLSELKGITLENWID